MLVIDDGALTDGRAILKGEVVRQQLEPRDPIVDTVRLGLHQLEANFGENLPLELLTFPMAVAAGIWLVAVLTAARQAHTGRARAQA